MTEPKRGARIFLVALLALDAMCALALARLPSRIELREAPSAIPNAAPGLGVVTDREVRFVVTAPYDPGESVLVRVPLGDAGAGDAPPPIVQRIGHDLALLEPVRGLDAFMPTGPRFAWNGQTLLLAAPSRRLGAQQVNVLAIGANGLVGEPRVIEGSRPSVGWARDHFEVTYVTPAPPPDVGRVVWAVDVNDAGVLSHDRIIESTGQVHDPFVWPGGVRAHAHGADPTEALLQDGTVVSMSRAGGDRVRAWFVLGGNGAIDARTVRSRTLSGSERAGDYTIRASWGNDTTIEAHLGSHVPSPHYVLTHKGRRRTFEASSDARLADAIAIERSGVLHLVDPRGFHARFRASDLASLDRHTPRLAWLAGTLGGTVLALLVVGMAFAHALAILVERAPRKIATLAGLTSVSIASAVLFVLWTAVVR
jgi:hypothetical protein